MRADRLLSILMLLQTKGRMTAHDLATQLEVSERTIYRDLEALSTAGIPVYTERGPGGGCSLIDGYQTRLTGLTEAEVRALFLFNMAGPLADLGLGKALDDALLKLEAALPADSRAKAEQVRQRFHVDTTWWYHSADTPSCLQIIQEALWQDRKLCLVYRENDGTWSEYRLDPYGLVSKASIWYLIGLCNDLYHVWRVSHIVRTVLLDEQFLHPVDFNLAQYWSEYCAQLEMHHPPYAVPLRLAPDDVEQLPQLLSEWGYTLMETEEALEPDEQVLPLHAHHSKSAYGVAESTAFNGAQWHLPAQKNGNGFAQRAGIHRSPAKKTTAPLARTSLSSSTSQQKKQGFVEPSQQKKESRGVTPQQKKGSRPTGRNKKNRLFVLDSAGDWLELARNSSNTRSSGLQKKVVLKSMPGTSSLQKQGTKRIEAARNDIEGQSKEKKAPLQQKKNAHVMSHIKKTGFRTGEKKRRSLANSFPKKPLIKKSNFQRHIKKSLYYFSFSSMTSAIIQPQCA